MASNINQFYKSFAHQVKERAPDIWKGAGWAAAGGAMAGAGLAYNRSQGRQTVGGDLGIGLGLAGGAFMGGRAVGMGRLMTAGGLQRMGHRATNLANHMGEGTLQSMARSVGGGLDNAANWSEATMSKSTHLSGNMKDRLRNGFTSSFGHVSEHENSFRAGAHSGISPLMIEAKK